MPRITRTGDKTLTTTPTRKFLEYGNSGTGKTHNKLTLPDSMRPALFLDIDHLADELRRLGGPDLGTIVEFDEVRNGRPCLHDDVRKFLKDFHTGTLKDLDFPCKEYKTVVLDSLTTFIAYTTDRAMEYSIKHGEGGLARENTQMPPTQPEYGMIAHQTLDVIRNGLFPLRRNLILVCHESSIHEDEATKERLVGPALQGAIAKALPRYMNEILLAKVKGVGAERKFVWMAQPSGRWLARSQFGLPAEVEQDYGIYAEATEVAENDSP